jgi:hypothetical protein
MQLSVNKGRLLRRWRSSVEALDDDRSSFSYGRDELVMGSVR